MLQKINSRRGGFTLVEIMIVVAIIALLASIAIPNFMRARLRTQATACKQDLRMIDAALEQWAMETNKKNGDAAPSPVALKGYVKENSSLYTNLAGGTAKDTLGNIINLPTVGTRLTVPSETYSACQDVTDATFWSPYITGT